MRIAYYAPAWPPAGAANGVVTYVDTMRRQLAAAGHEVHVMSQGRLYGPDGMQHDMASPADQRGLWQRFTARFDHRRGDYPAIARRLSLHLRRAHARHAFDIVEMEESFGWSRIVQRALDVPVITRLHGPQFMKAKEPCSPVEQRKADRRAASEGRAIGVATGISAPTANTLSCTQDHYGHPLPGAAVIPNPVSAHPGAINWRQHRNPELILFVGRLDYLKGADTVLDAFAQVARARPLARLLMVGPDAGVPLPDGRLLKADDYAAWRLGPDLQRRVTFTGTLEPSEIVTLRQRAALTVIGSRHETFCFAAVEAMAAASPLICTAWDGSADVVEDGVTGWLTPVGDADRMANQICWALDHPDEAACVGAAAWRRCREAYAPEAVGARAVEFYREVIARHAAR